MKMREMSSLQFDTFKEKSIERRSKFHETEANLCAEDALAKAQDEFTKYCPHGIKTNDQFFFNVIIDDDICAGYIWFAIREKNNSKRLFINDILVEEPFRRRGISKYMLTWLEQKACEMGLSEIGLHVLGDNTVARNLYDKMGFKVTNLDMGKKLKGLKGSVN